ncbi:MAG TPA: hypothetical protein VLC09_18095 [Polyangiaceae bacterium]|nr:hypothetical protein [Polyangiaceae bacterium]
MRKRCLLPALTCVLLGCAETPLELFAQQDAGEPPSSADASDDSSADAGTDGSASDVHWDCRATTDITHRVLIQNVQAKACLTRSAAIVVADTPAFSLTLEPCDGRAEAIFLPILGTAGDYQFRHEISSDNLDVRLASSDDGATLVLFDPHGLYNQRFFSRPLATPGQMQLAPRHIPDKCLALRGDQLELWPCDSAAADQIFELPRCGAQL